MNARLSVVFAAVLAAGAALGQPPATPVAAGPTFDVASVRPSPAIDPVKMQAEMQAGRMPKFGENVSKDRAEYNQMPLRDLIASAYQVKPYQIAGPDWINSNAQRFDIVATIPEGASKDDVPKMLQALLADRFKLTAHIDDKEQPVYALIVGKGGPKMKPSTDTLVALDDDAPLKPGEMKMNSPFGPIRVTRKADGSTGLNMGLKGSLIQRMDAQTQTLHFDSTGVTMGGFCEVLSTMMTMGRGATSGSRQVVDMTGLTGAYQVTLGISMADLMAMARASGAAVPGGSGGAAASGGAPTLDASDPGGGGVSVFKSIESMGLKLDARKAKIPQLVIDHVEKAPTDN